MQLKSTTKIFSGALIFGMTLLSSGVYAQSSGCQNEQVLWSEDFGTGTTVVSNPDVVNLTFQPTGPLETEGVYRITTNTQQKFDWLSSSDHTGNPDGRMIVANGQAESFYQKVITRNNGFTDGTYSVSFWIMNVNTTAVCGIYPLLPNITIKVEYLSQSNQWIALEGSPYHAGEIPLSTTPTWVYVGSSFNLPPLGLFAPSQMRITVSDGTQGGCGNDFAADDFKLGFCPEGGPAPVTFVDVTAKQKGSGVTINWSTSQEINNDHFEVERSDNGNSGWQTLASVPGAGNSQLAHSYNSFDAHPSAGQNYYRIKQVDKDGKASYSKTVSVRVDIIGTRVSVLANPFRSNLSVQFSGNAQLVNARLIDITGKQVAKETWNVSNGESSRQFGSVSNLQNGIYILTIQNSAGELLFNGKVLKQ